MTKTITVCEFNAERVRSLILLNQGRQKPPLVIGCAEGTSDGYAKGEFLQLADAAESIWQVVRACDAQAGIKTLRCVVNLDDPHLESVRAEGGSSTERGFESFGTRHVQEARRRAFQSVPPTDRHLIYRAAAGYRIDRKDIVGDPVGIVGRELTAVLHFLYSRSERAQSLRFAFERADLKVDGLFPSVLAALYGVTTAEQRKKNLLCLLVQSSVWHGMLYAHGAIQQVRSALVDSEEGGEELLREAAEYLKHVDGFETGGILVTGEQMPVESVLKAARGHFSTDVISAIPLHPDPDVQSGRFAVALGLYELSQSEETVSMRPGALTRWLLPLRARAQSFVQEYF